LPRRAPRPEQQRQQAATDGEHQQPDLIVAVEHAEGQRDDQAQSGRKF
jgi:hypothetical protein